MTEKRKVPHFIKYIGVTKIIHANLDVLQKYVLNVDANRSLSDSWKKFTKFTLLEETPPKQGTYMWVRGD